MSKRFSQNIYKRYLCNFVYVCVLFEENWWCYPHTLVNCCLITSYFVNVFE